MVLGLITFYQHLERKALNREDQALPTSKLAFTNELLALYLYSQCSAAKKKQLSVYQQHLTKTDRLFVSDVLLFRTVQIQSSEQQGIPDEHSTSDDTENKSQSSMDTSLLVTSLELVALEKLITCRQMMVRELHSEQFPIMNEFEVLYAYKCGLFEQCLEMCRSYVTMFLRAHDCQPNLQYLVMYPEMLSLLDGELVSLCGIVRLLYPLLWLLRANFPSCCDISVATLSLYLMVQCQKKLGSGSLQETLRLILLLHNCMAANLNDDDSFIDRLVLRMTYRSLKLQYAQSRRANERS